MLRRQRPNPEAAKCANAQEKKNEKKNICHLLSFRDINDSDIILLIQMLRFNHRSKNEPKSYVLSHRIRDPGKGLPRAPYTARKKKVCPAEARHVLYR